jgi:murein DD-endopeptidase MepM/ murein hydrolase activator NlpD
VSGHRLLAVLATLLIGPVGLALAADPVVRVDPPSPAPGDVVLVQVTGGPPDVAGTLGARPLRFFPVTGGHAALVGLDLDTRPGPLPWRVHREAAGGPPRVIQSGSLRVRSREFGLQRLSLPPGQVDIDALTLARVQAERAELQAALTAGVAARLWRGRFVTPVQGGQPTGGFGLRRVINGQPRSPHAGFDWAAPVGTPVSAAGAGRVALVADHFFAGRLVVLDHGLGLFTLYFHLDETHVQAGARVEGGDRVGTVGATGRVTGPHLHFAVLLDGARVDPESLLGLTPPDGASSP